MNSLLWYLDRVSSMNIFVLFIYFEIRFFCSINSALNCLISFIHHFYWSNNIWCKHLNMEDIFYLATGNYLSIKKIYFFTYSSNSYIFSVICFISFIVFSHSLEIFDKHWFIGLTEWFRCALFCTCIESRVICSLLCSRV